MFVASKFYSEEAKLLRKLKPMRPISDPHIFKMYQAARSSFWLPSKVRMNMTKDRVDYNKMSRDEKNLVKNVCGFFANSDDLVVRNIPGFSKDFEGNICIGLWLNMQAAVEDVHRDVYSQFLEDYCETPEELERIKRSIVTSKSISQKAAWCMRYVGTNVVDIPRREREDIIATYSAISKLHEDPNISREIKEKIPLPKHFDKIKKRMGKNLMPLNQRMFAFVIMEGLYFSSSFCIAFWLKKLNILPSFTFANEYIQRDEGMHADMNIYLFLYKCEKMPETTARNMMTEAVSYELEYIDEIMPTDHREGMTRTNIKKYVKYVADSLMVACNYSPIYNVKQPFPFMDSIGIGARNPDFLKKTSSEYMLKVKKSEVDYSKFM